jgi:hypothetical protein
MSVTISCDEIIKCLDLTLAECFTELKGETQKARDINHFRQLIYLSANTLSE